MADKSMRVKPKRIGSDFNLDEYNACQYLLLRMGCWNDSVTLNTAVYNNGRYASYRAVANTSTFIDGGGDTFIVNKDCSSSDILYVEVSSQNDFFKKLHVGYKATLKIKKPVTQMLPDDDDNISVTTNNSDEIPEFSVEEDHTSLKADSTFDVECIYDSSSNCIGIPLVDESGAGLVKETILFRDVTFNLNLYDKPYIDVDNGVANNLDEILVDNENELINLIKYAPTNSTKTIIRLDSSISAYKLSRTITIEDGQFITIIGGSNTRAVIEGSAAKRSFIVQSGGHLILKNLELKENHVEDDDDFSTRGAAVYVASSSVVGDDSFGILECNNCYFHDNSASYGGAIYGGNVGLYINNCTFTNNKGTIRGGAVAYYSLDINMEFLDMFVETGDIIDLIVYVTDYTGKAVGDGYVDIYLPDDDTDNPSYPDIALTENYQPTVNGKYTGKNVFVVKNYEVPSVAGNYYLIAKYHASQNDVEVTKSTLYVTSPEAYTATLNVNTSNAYPEDTIILTATVTNQNKVITTIPSGYFTFDDTKLETNTSNDTYTCKYMIPSDTKKGKHTIKFDLEDDYVCDEKSTTITIEEKKTTTTEYITGLFINQTLNSSGECSITSSDVETWENNGITDVYVRMIEWTNTSANNKYRKTLVKVASLCKDSKIRVHAVLNAFYQSVSVKWRTPNETARMNWLKKEIDSICQNCTVDGFCMDYMRYAGYNNSKINAQKSPTNGHKNVTQAMKTLQEYIKNKGNYTVSVCVFPEKAGTKEYYGQNYKALSSYTDYEMPMVYKYDYRNKSTGVEASDTWATGVIEYMQNEMDDNKSNIVAILQTYTDSKGTLRSTDNLESTMMAITTTNIKGASLFRYGLIKDYPKSYTEIIGE